MAQLQARLAGLDIDLDKKRPEAPFAGTVAARTSDEGTVVSAGQTILRLVENDRLQARIGVPQQVSTASHRCHRASSEDLGYAQPHRLHAGRQAPQHSRKPSHLLAEAGYPNGRDAKTGEPWCCISIRRHRARAKSRLDWLNK